MSKNILDQRSDEEKKQSKMRAAYMDAETYALEAILEEEMAKDSNNLEHFFLHVKYEKLKKDCKVNKLIYLYVGIVVGIISSLFMAVLFS
ncbi:hypothetical protein GJV85_12280 [Sulfurimonas aquatica]|uniref:Uncharacterized protein n=1 Tax=Sulfurimonas aquatica TaxID=2672570 RepID=A0A975B263_9BACT|nr:hypothetical protein [Sulfurimonas aquatica]QSZ42852.1 hypothetical protein GJV85_12280 [Sulfurimonas aquatica]